MLDGFTVADTLVIKAQVQVILDKPGRPFRCLDPQYRRELVRVYLTNVEGVCRRFCDDKRARLMWAKEEQEKFKAFWEALSPEQQRKQLTEKGEAILKVGSPHMVVWHPAPHGVLHAGRGPGLFRRAARVGNALPPHGGGPHLSRGWVVWVGGCGSWQSRAGPLYVAAAGRGQAVLQREGGDLHARDGCAVLGLQTDGGPQPALCQGATTARMVGWARTARRTVVSKAQTEITPPWHPGALVGGVGVIAVQDWCSEYSCRVFQ